ncbi:hypothetical protein TrCOL_g7363 [Triparma columacea]|uniref:Uncharacterized protein n=1 Tax=Triparma columacea TaxID=722753 RepID=A0A9W7LD58_9STRA|nr:hypothetical protein TrCOL_g7363 [Triparma columacea]
MSDNESTERDMSIPQDIGTTEINLEPMLETSIVEETANLSEGDAGVRVFPEASLALSSTTSLALSSSSSLAKAGVDLAKAGVDLETTISDADIAEDAKNDTIEELEGGDSDEETELIKKLLGGKQQKKRRVIEDSQSNEEESEEEWVEKSERWRVESDADDEEELVEDTSTPEVVETVSTTKVTEATEVSTEANVADAEESTSELPNSQQRCTMEFLSPARAESPTYPPVSPATSTVTTQKPKVYYHIGEPVYVNYEDEVDGSWAWWAATVTRVNMCKTVNTYDVKYECDGTREDGIHPQFIMSEREYFEEENSRAPKKARQTTGKTGGDTDSSADGAGEKGATKEGGEIAAPISKAKATAPQLVTSKFRGLPKKGYEWDEEKKAWVPKKPTESTKVVTKKSPRTGVATMQAAAQAMISSRQDLGGGEGLTKTSTKSLTKKHKNITQSQPTPEKSESAIPFRLHGTGCFNTSIFEEDSLEDEFYESPCEMEEGATKEVEKDRGSSGREDDDNFWVIHSDSECSGMLGDDDSWKRKGTRKEAYIDTSPLCTVDTESCQQSSSESGEEKDLVHDLFFFGGREGPVERKEKESARDQGQEQGKRGPICGLTEDTPKAQVSRPRKRKKLIIDLIDTCIPPPRDTVELENITPPPPPPPHPSLPKVRTFVPSVPNLTILSFLNFMLPRSLVRSTQKPKVYHHIGEPVYVNYEDDVDGSWAWWAATVTRVNMCKNVNTYDVKYETDGTREDGIHPQFIMSERDYLQACMSQRDYERDRAKGKGKEGEVRTFAS